MVYPWGICLSQQQPAELPLVITRMEMSAIRLLAKCPENNQSIIRPMGGNKDMIVIISGDDIGTDALLRQTT